MVVSFLENRGVILSLGKSLQEAEKALKGKLIQLQVPDYAPPDTPRVLIKATDLTLSVGYNRFDILVVPPSHIISDYNSSIEYSLNKTSQILSLFNNDFPVYEWAGVVSTIAFPDPSKDYLLSKVISLLFDKLIRLDRNGHNLNSFQLAYGYSDDGFNRTFNIAGFETRNVRIPKLRGNESVEIPLGELPVVETGIQLSIDINNKPGKNKTTFLKDLKRLSEEHLSTFSKFVRSADFEEVYK